MNSITSSSSKTVQQRTGGLAPGPKKKNMPFRQGPPMRDKTRKVDTKDMGHSLAVTGNGAGSSDSQEESYQLCPDSGTAPRPFCMIVRLTPEILEELKQAEADRTTSMMKFGSSASAHVIRVGDENFKFSSAPEPGDLCDIFEERITDNQHKFLIEAGSAWRKLSILRTLSASEKDRLKLRTAEAEKKQKSRKSILVDPNTQLILPQTAVTEVTARNSASKLWKEPPPKRLKVTGSPVVGSTPNLPISNATSLVDGHQSDLHSCVSLKPINVLEGATQGGSRMPTRENIAVEGTSFGHSANKGVPIPKENTPNASTFTGGEDGRTKPRINMTELRNGLITILQENPKGMTIKAIEKAVTENMTVHPDRKSIEKVIKSIASFHAPGKYLLNPGVEKESIVETSGSKAGETASCTRLTEEGPSSDILKIDFGKDKNREEMQNSASHQSEALSEKAVSPHSPQITVSETHTSKDKQEDSHGISDPKAPSSGEDSDSSSSSECGSESDSESQSSESGTSGSSDTDSSSESDASSSSSGTCSDEDIDVDIMSDDEDGKKLELKQEKSIVEDGEVQESGPENIEFWPKDQTQNAEHGDTSVKNTTENIIQSVFKSSTRQNEIDQLELMKPTTEMMKDNKEKNFSSEKQDMNSGSTESNNVYHSSGHVDLDTQGAKTFEHLGILIDKICDENNEGIGNKKLSQSPRSLSTDDIMGSENQHLHVLRKSSEPSNMEKREQSGDNSVDGTLQLNLPNKGEFKTEPVRAKGRMKGMEKSNQEIKLKQINAKKLSRSGSKRADCTENRVGKAEVNDINTENSFLSTVKDKNPETIRSLSLPVGKTEGLRIVKSSDHDGCRKEDVQVKEKVSKNHYKTRINKGIEKQPSHQRDGSRINVNSDTSMKDSEGLVESHRGALLGENTTKERGKNAGCLRKMKPMQQLAENRLKDMDISSKYGSLARIDVSMEESVGRAVSNGLYSKDGQSLEITNSGSGLSSHREDDAHGVPLQDAEIGEFQEPFSGNECSEHGTKFPKTEITKKKAILEGRMSLSIKKSQSVSLSSSEISKQSSARIDGYENNSHGPSKLPKKRLVSNEPTQSNHALVKDRKGKEGSSSSDVRELQRDAIKYEESNKTAFGKVSTISHKRTSSMPVSKHKTSTPEMISKHVSGRVKKHTPQSSAVQGSEFFAPYEKRVPELRGPIYNSEQFKEYHKEFKEKYPIYALLNKTIEINKEEFTTYWNNIEQAKFGGDKDKLASLYTEVRKEYLHCRKRCKRMRQTFNILHEELQAIKRRCQEYYLQITKK